MFVSRTENTLLFVIVAPNRVIDVNYFSKTFSTHHHKTRVKEVARLSKHFVTVADGMTHLRGRLRTVTWGKLLGSLQK